jgi:hypothetical protein
MTDVSFVLGGYDVGEKIRHSNCSLTLVVLLLSSLGTTKQRQSWHSRPAEPCTNHVLRRGSKISASRSVLSIDVVEDEQPGSVVRAREPSHDILYYRIYVSAAVSSVRPARLSNPTLGNSASTARDAALESILALSIQPEN